MTEAMQQITRTETNRLIRTDLKTTHPGTTFTVQSTHAAGLIQTVIGWEIGYHPTAATYDGHYSPNTCTLAPGPTEDDVDALAAHYSSWEWNGSAKDHAPDRLVATEAGQLPIIVRYGAGNVTTQPRYKNLDL